MSEQTTPSDFCEIKPKGTALLNVMVGESDQHIFALINGVIPAIQSKETGKWAVFPWRNLLLIARAADLDEVAGDDQ